MAINPFSKPVGGDGQGGANLVPMRPEQPDLPVQQLALAAKNYQKRRTEVKDEMGQAMTKLAETATTPQNRQTFRAMTKPVRKKLNQIAESDNLINKDEEVRKLANQVTQKVKYFEQNQKNLEESRKNLADQNLTPRQRRAAQKQLKAQANVEVGEDGSIRGGLTQPQQYGEMTTPFEVVDDLDFGKVVRDVEARMPDGQVRRMKKKGVFRDRIRREAKRRMGLAEDAPMNPGLANWMQAEARAISMNNPNIDQNEVQTRINSKLTTAIRSAEDRYREEGKAYRPEGADDSDSISTEEGDGLYMYPSETVGGNVNNLESLNISPAKKEELRAVSKQKQEVILEGAKQNHGISGQNYRKIKSQKKNLQESSSSPQTPTPGPFSATGSENASNQSLRNWVMQNYQDGQSIWDAYQAVDEKMKKAEEVSINQQFIGVDEAEKANRLERRVMGAMPSAEKLQIPGATGGTFEGSRVEERNALMSNAKLVGFGNEGNMLQFRYTGDSGTENFSPNDKFIVEMPQAMRDAFINEGDSEILGDRMAKIISQNQEVSDKTVGQDWSDIGGEIDLRLSFTNQRGRIGAKGAGVEYEVRADGEQGTYGRVVKALEQSNDSPSTKKTYFRRLMQLAKRDSSMDPNVIASAMQNGVDGMSDQHRQELENTPISLKNKGVAAEWGQTLKKIQ